MDNEPTIITAKAGRGKTGAHMTLMDELCAASALRKAMRNLQTAMDATEQDVDAWDALSEIQDHLQIALDKALSKLPRGLEDLEAV